MSLVCGGDQRDEPIINSVPAMIDTAHVDDSHPPPLSASPCDTTHSSVTSDSCTVILSISANNLDSKSTTPLSPSQHPGTTASDDAHWAASTWRIAKLETTAIRTGRTSHPLAQAPALARLPFGTTRTVCPTSLRTTNTDRASPRAFAELPRLLVHVDSRLSLSLPYKTS